MAPSCSTSPAGDEWLTLLEALEQPHRSGRVRAAALTSFLGHTLSELDRGGETLTDELADRLRGWALLLRGRGVAALFEATEERGLTARVLGTVGGERLLTDLRHVAQTLHETARRDSLGLTGLLEWLRSERENASQERVRRLDSDAAAVQITTVHQSKGLQYPVVHLPFASMTYVWPVDVARYHEADGTRMLDVAGGGAGWPAHEQAHLREEAGEELRDLYVALTRAQSQVVTWWAPTANTPNGGLHRLLFGRQPGQSAVPDAQAVKDDDYVTKILGLLDQLGGPSPEDSVVSVETPSPAPVATGDLAARRFDREVDTEWRRTSYSGLIRVQEQPTGVTSEPERDHWDPTESDASGRSETEASLLARPPDLGPPDSARGAGRAVAHGRPAVGRGVRQPRPRGARGERPRGTRPPRRAGRPRPGSSSSGGRSGSVPTSSPTRCCPRSSPRSAPRRPGCGWSTSPLRDRLCELDFEFPLTGGDRPDAARPEVRLRDLAPLLAAHLPADDPLAPYAGQLTGELGDQSLRGYLSGSIDVVLRVPGDPGRPHPHRYVVVDYKTNLLGETGVPVTSADYGHAEMAAAMLHSHYPLQALLYSVVLHRYLRWRLPSYAPEQHLGGVLYLFLRGMCGPETPVVDGHVAGVFDWAPPAALVTDLSDLLEGSS